MYTPVPPVVGQSDCGRGGDLAGLLPGDEVVAADGVSMRLWLDW